MAPPPVIRRATPMWCFTAVIEIDFLGQRLVPPDQRGGRKAQKAQGVRHGPGLV